MARATKPIAARPTKLFKLGWCTAAAAAFKLEMVAGAEPLVGVADKVTPCGYTQKKKTSN